MTEHWAKARYSRSTSRPRFSSLRNSCTHLRGTALPEFQPGRRSCPEWAQNRHGKGPWCAVAPGRHQAAPASEDPVMLRDGRGLRQDPQFTHPIGGSQAQPVPGEGVGRGAARGNTRGCLEAGLP